MPIPAVDQLLVDELTTQILKEIKSGVLSQYEGGDMIAQTRLTLALDRIADSLEALVEQGKPEVAVAEMSEGFVATYCLEGRHSKCIFHTACSCDCHAVESVRTETRI